VGLGLLSSDGVAGVAAWVVGDGFAKAALFTAVAVLQHRFETTQEGSLHGRGRDLRSLGVLVALAALMIADLPATGSFLGRSIVDDAALKVHGYGWVPALATVVGALVGGTLLRMAGRVFLGMGEPAGTDPHA